MEIKLKVCSQRCDECLFSPNRLVSIPRMQRILEGCKKDDTHFSCHKGTLAGNQDIVCRGFYENKSSRAIRFAKELDLIEFVNPTALTPKYAEHLTSEDENKLT